MVWNEGMVTMPFSSLTSICDSVPLRKATKATEKGGGEPGIKGPIAGSNPETTALQSRRQHHGPKQFPISIRTVCQRKVRNRPKDLE